MEAMVQRLDRLTQDEARQTVAQILKVVHGLVENMKVVMNGEQIQQARRVLGVEDISLDGEVSVDHLKESLGMFFRPQSIDCVSD
jgi:uncharacterized protein YpuA (DUF1002 family)